MKKREVVIDTWDIIPEKKHKPTREELVQLNYIKRLKRKNKIEEAKLQPFLSIEITIGELATQHKRGVNRQNQIKLLIEKIKELQREWNIQKFTRDFLRSILKENTNLSERVINKKLKELLKNAKEKEGIITKKVLINYTRYEKKLKGELTTSPICPIEKRLEERFKIQKFYSFL